MACKQCLRSCEIRWERGCNGVGGERRLEGGRGKAWRERVMGSDNKSLVMTIRDLTTATPIR